MTVSRSNSSRAGVSSTKKANHAVQPRSLPLTIELLKPTQHGRIDRRRLRERVLPGGCLRGRTDLTRARRCERQTASQCRIELFDVHRFWNVIIHSRLQTALSVALHRIRRHADDGRVTGGAFPIADFRCRLVPVHEWHLAIHQHRGAWEFFKCLQCLQPIGGNL